MTIRVTSRIEAEAEARDDVPRFAPLPETRDRFPFAMVLSLAFHMAGAAAAPPALEFLDQLSKPMIDFRRAVIVPRDAMPLVVRMPDEPLLIRLPKLRAAEAPKLRSIRAQMQAPAAPQAQAVQPKPLPPARPVPRQAPVATAILLQPKLKPVQWEEIPDLRTLAVWTGRSPKATALPVAVGTPEPVASVVTTAIRTAPEVPIAAPVRMPTPSQLPETAAIRPKLTLPPSGSSPLQSEVVKLEEPSIPPGSNMAGEAAAIIALSTMTAKPGEVLPVPPGSVVILGSGASAGAPKPPQAQGALPQAQSAAPQATSAAPQAPNPVQQAQGAVRQAHSVSPESALKPAAEPAKVTTARAEGEARPATPAARSAAVESPLPGKAAATAAAGETRSIRTLSGEIRVQTGADGTVSLTYPSDGNFDVVVVESALPEALAQFGQSLSGRPVHTAYLNVGAAAEWVLQYCLPQGQAGGAEQHGMVVSLDAPAPLKAPYLIRATLPAEAGWRSAGYQVIHGLLNAAGRVEQARAIRAETAPASLLSALGTWLFRPAMSAGVPKAVEFLLVIPPRSGTAAR